MVLRVESSDLGVVWKEVEGSVWRAAPSTKARRRDATETSGVGDRVPDTFYNPLSPTPGGSCGAPGGAPPGPALAKLSRVIPPTRLGSEYPGVSGAFGSLTGGGAFRAPSIDYHWVRGSQKTRHARLQARQGAGYEVLQNAKL